MCSPIGIHVAFCLPALRLWPTVEDDVSAAIFQTCDTQRDVYMRPRRESKDLGHYFLLLAALYGLVHANAKFLSRAHDLVMNMWLFHMVIIAQLSFQSHSESVFLVLIKIVGDFLLTEDAPYARSFLREFDSTIELGTVACGHETLKFYGMSTSQFYDFSFTMNADDKLHRTESFPLLRVQHCKCDSPFTSVENSSFMSINSAVVRHRTAASPLCAF